MTDNAVILSLCILIMTASELSKLYLLPRWVFHIGYGAVIANVMLGLRNGAWQFLSLLALFSLVIWVAGNAKGRSLQRVAEARRWMPWVILLLGGLTAFAFGYLLSSFGAV